MKNFRIENGDLALGTNNHVDMVRGKPKLIQDLTLWLLEPIGIGYTTPSWGSTLTAMGKGGASTFIGHTISEVRMAEIQAEIDRVLNLYQQGQIERIKSARIRGDLSMYQKGEILDTINNIDVSTSKVYPDMVVAAVQIQTGLDSITLIITDDTEDTQVATA